MDCSKKAARNFSSIETRCDRRIGENNDESPRIYWTDCTSSAAKRTRTISATRTRRLRVYRVACVHSLLCFVRGATSSGSAVCNVVCVDRSHRFPLFAQTLAASLLRQWTSKIYVHTYTHRQKNFPSPPSLVAAMHYPALFCLVPRSLIRIAVPLHPFLISLLHNAGLSVLSSAPLSSFSALAKSTRSARSFSFRPPHTHIFVNSLPSLCQLVHFQYSIECDDKNKKRRLYIPNIPRYIFFFVMVRVKTSPALFSSKIIQLEQCFGQQLIKHRRYRVMKELYIRFSSKFLQIWVAWRLRPDAMDYPWVWNENFIELELILNDHCSKFIW